MTKNQKLIVGSVIGLAVVGALVYSASASAAESDKSAASNTPDNQQIPTEGPMLADGIHCYEDEEPIKRTDGTSSRRYVVLRVLGGQVQGQIWMISDGLFGSSLATTEPTASFNARVVPGGILTSYEWSVTQAGRDTNRYITLQGGPHGALYLQLGRSRMKRSGCR
jgi:hypothetical protein